MNSGAMHCYAERHDFGARRRARAGKDGRYDAGGCYLSKNTST